MHGIKVNELVTGARDIKAISSAIIGLVATAGVEGVAPDQAAAATAALDAAFPPGRRTLVTDVRGAIAKAGASGTLAPALAAIADQCNPIVVVVRVPVAGAGAPSQDSLAIDAIPLLLGAEAEFGARPRILGAPGLDTLAVTTEMTAIARRLRAMNYAMAVGGSVAEAIEYRDNFGARELMLLWPGFTGGGADTVARALGLRARIDQETGWHKTLSNIAVEGVTGLARDVFFDLNGDDDNDAALLNNAEITTMIRQNGFRFWGNRTTSDEPRFAFESTVRTAQLLQDEIAGGLFWAIDKPLTRVLVRDIVETINGRFRALVADGRLIGANAWADWSLNPADQLAAGKLVIDYDYTAVAPLEGLTLNARITDRYYADFASLPA